LDSAQLASAGDSVDAVSERNATTEVRFTFVASQFVPCAPRSN
jgi:hypothetical protein